MYREFKYFVADFETTVFEGQTYTEVWAGALVKMYTENVEIYHSIDEFFDGVFKNSGNLVVYFHNLKFDGQFIIPYLIRKGYEQAYENGKYLRPKDMPNNTFTCTISDMGMWYKINVKQKRRIIEIRDSLKLLPFSVKAIGESFKTKHQKLDMKYKGFRYAGCEITDAEKQYIANDVLVVKEALEFMFQQGHNKLTIGSCCLTEFKSEWRKDVYAHYFPDLYEVPLNPDVFGCDNAFDYIRKSYRGGWCYLVEEKANKIFHNGITLDVNSLYPSVMHSASGNKYPTGAPFFWTGGIPPEATYPRRFYFVRFKCRFYLKEGKLPFVQLKGNRFYRQNECLRSSDIVINGKRCGYYKTLDGDIADSTVTMTMTETEFELFKDHYYVTNLEILDGCYFNAEYTLFDEYINRYYKIKQESTGAMRQLAKLFLNNLYGKMASSRVSNFKMPYVVNGELAGYATVKAQDKQAGYIPIGSAITSYARCFTIRSAQANYRYFIYADTDSLHMNCKPSQVRGCEIDSKDLLKWKLETQWDTGLFVRQKTYIEITGDNIDVKCAGMPETSKQEFIEKMGTGELELSDFKTGLVLGGKLVPKRIKGGVILCETSYEIR